MQTPRHPLTPALRDVALSLTVARDAGAEHRDLVRAVTARSTSCVDDELVEDILLAAGQLLVGVDPHLSALAGAWGEHQVALIATQTAVVLRGLRRA